MRRGQVALYLLMTIVVLAVVAFMNVDIFLAVRAKNRVQNAGDAAALAAARKQGELLNEIGRLNIRHILAAAKDDSDECRAIELEQKRRVLLGPIEALQKANEAAKDNGVVPQGDFVQILKDHVETIRTVYSGGVNADGDPYPEPWPGAWVEYASAIEEAMQGGLAVGPDNNEYYDANGGHILLNKNFYFAIAGRCWCWFRNSGNENILRNYGGWSSWGPLPSRKTNSEGNSELFSLHVQAQAEALWPKFTYEEISALATKWGEPVSIDQLQRSFEITNPAAVWFYLDRETWSQWFDGLRLLGTDDDVQEDFPLVGEVKREYNVRGVAAVCRCILTSPGITDKDETAIVWCAAAKPFGRIVDAVEGNQPVTYEKYKCLVLPVFEAVRLVPIDTVGGADLSTADMEWVEFLRKYLPIYMNNGPSSVTGSYYGRLLGDWERPEFRRSGIRWLDKNTCVRGSGGGGSRGGTRHGH